MTKLNFYLKEGGNGKVHITHSKLLDFLAEAGYGRVKQGETYILAHQQNKQLRQIDASELSRYIQSKIRDTNSLEVLEPFVKGVGNFLTAKKLELLPEHKVISDMDSKESSRFYFKNCYVVVTKEGFDEFNYNSLEQSIWTNRLIRRKFRLAQAKPKGQFERFCQKIAGGDPEKFKQLQSAIGYLLHRYKNPSLTKAIILYDPNMHKSAGAEGGTGKTLLSMAIGKCRDLVVYNGKELKDGSWFKNQRVTLTTDLVVYDDVPSNFNFESLFPILTTGIEIERKREHSFEIPFEQSPKVLISSNYYVKGPGGSSDRRRRYEFEVANVYNDKHTPYDDFGQNFFEEWSFEEWNSFFLFMMKCVQCYLKEGLIVEEEANNSKRRIEGMTSIHFYEMMELLVVVGEKNNQRELIDLLKSDHPELSSHQFTKWLKIYCSEKGYNLDQKPSGGDYYFYIAKK